ncbi:MAG: heavy metal-binding domain-containing protein [Bacteroidia bacterium]|nr:heavy metal-binding domain-containing protein [Bacteroidia bacterium]
MILTTTPTVEGRLIKEYRGVVFGEVVNGVNFLKDFRASVRNFIGGRSSSYESELIDARSKALQEMADRACRLGANAVVGINVAYEALGEANGMLMVTASGTAVVLE